MKLRQKMYEAVNPIIPDRQEHKAFSFEAVVAIVVIDLYAVDFYGAMTIHNSIMRNDIFFSPKHAMWVDYYRSKEMP